MSRAQKRHAEKQRLAELRKSHAAKLATRHAPLVQNMAEIRAHFKQLAIARDMHQPRRRPHTDRNVWAKHEVDQGFWNGHRFATRGAAPTRAQYGMAQQIDRDWRDFIVGRGLRAHKPGYWRVTTAAGRLLGYAPPKDALAYRIAADAAGVTLEVYSE